MTFLELMTHDNDLKLTLKQLASYSDLRIETTKEAKK